MKRSLSLDVLRGMAVLLMVVLSNQVVTNNLAGSGVFSFLESGVWDGLKLADMVFPCFLFIMGASLWFSRHKRTSGGSVHLTKPTKSGQVWKILRRALLLFILGVLLNWLPFTESWAHLRIPGILQRIALSYLGAALLTLYLPKARAILPTIIVLLCGYWLVLNYLGVGIVGRIDVALFGENHLLHPNFDPAGLLATLPSIASVLIGYLSGKLMDKPHHMSGGIASLMVFGLIVGLVGYLLSWVWPMNQQLWTGSFVLFTAGVTMAIWSLLSFVIEYMQVVKWTGFFAIGGTNSLFIFCLSVILAKLFALWGVTAAVYTFYQSYHVSAPVASLMWSLTMVAICWLPTWPLWRRQIFLIT